MSLLPSKHCVFCKFETPPEKLATKIAMLVLYFLMFFKEDIFSYILKFLFKKILNVVLLEMVSGHILN